VGLVGLGVRLVVFKLYEIRKRRTMPTALLMGAWMLMFVSLATNMEVLTLSPQYATFGTQTYNPVANGTDVEQCTMDVSDFDGQCTMSQVGRFIHLINIELPFFGVIFFFSNILFVAAFFVFLLREIVFYNRTSSYETLREQASDDAFYAEDR